jgi:hypothetical protein
MLSLTTFTLRIRFEAQILLLYETNVRINFSQSYWTNDWRNDFSNNKIGFSLKMVSKPSEVLGTALKADWTGIPRFGSVTYAYRQL